MKLRVFCGERYLPHGVNVSEAVYIDYTDDDLDSLMERLKWQAEGATEADMLASDWKGFSEELWRVIVALRRAAA